MTANEARALAEAAQTGKLEEIYGYIKSAAEKGEYRCHTYFVIDPKDKAQLESDGYKVTNLEDPREICFEISWGPNPYRQEEIR